LEPVQRHPGGSASAARQLHLAVPEPAASGPLTAALGALLDELRRYVPSDAREGEMRDRVVALIEADGEAAFTRANLRGHITASAWIVDPERTRAVLLHHRKLDRWLQLGGHVDGEFDVRASAEREAREESGLQELRSLGAGIYDIDVHVIPARGVEPEHEHHDLRFAFEADPREPLVRNDESHEVRWIALAEIESYTIDESVRRLVRKMPRL
jgi:8-oxo-dGTP pyrophosphatase MutT (NUDIX family)